MIQKITFLAFFTIRDKGKAEAKRWLNSKYRTL
jgi:hypothetical protein